jgi:intracellular proteinase inhibitor BsuPI
MHFRLKLWTVMVLCFAGCSSQGLYRWVPFAGHGRKDHVPTKTRAEKNNPFGPITGPVNYGLEMRVLISPDPIKLSDTRSFEARIQLINRSRKSQNLIFDTGREYDFVLRDAGGKKLVQWSDDQPANPNPGYVIINPNERSEFVGNISTRDMVAGRSYVLEAMIVGYDKMRTTVNLEPAK